PVLLVPEVDRVEVPEGDGDVLVERHAEVRVVGTVGAVLKVARVAAQPDRVADDAEDAHGVAAAGDDADAEKGAILQLLDRQALPPAPSWRDVTGAMEGTAQPLCSQPLHGFREGGHGRFLRVSRSNPTREVHRAAGRAP